MLMAMEFQRYLEGQGRAKNTVQGYLVDMGQFAGWFAATNGEALTPEGLTPIDVRLYRQFMQAEKARPATVNRRLAALRAFGSMLEGAGLAPANPAREVKGLKEQAGAPRWLDKRDQARLVRELERTVNAAHTDPARRQAARDRAVCLLMLNAGLRVGEVCALEAGDLDMGPRKGRLLVRGGKGGKDRRLPLNATARAALEAWLKARGEGGGEAVFLGQRGEALTARAVERRLEEIGRRAGIDATPHTLRHSFAKNLVDAGVTLEKVAMLLGHERLDTTRRYITPGEEDLARAVELLDL